MIKKFFTLLCLCTLCIGSVWGNIIYEKVTSSLSDWSGEYLIVYESNKVAFDGSLTNLDATPNTFSVTISNNAITLSDADATAKQFTITAAETSGEYYIKSASGYYIWGTSSNGISSHTSISNAKTNTISYSNNTFTIKGKGGSKTLSFNSDKTQLKFRYLGTTLIQLYKKQSGTPTKTLTSISISGTPTKTTYYDGDKFDPTGLVVTGTYSEGDPEVITSGITWNVTPSPLTEGTTSVSVTATVGEITSPAYQVNGLTVTEKPALPSYKLVTDASTLTAGDRILIVGTESDVYYALAPYVSGNNCKRNEVSAPVDGIIDTEVAHITLGGAAGAWTLFDGTYYLYAAGGTDSNNYLKGAANADNDNAKWTISIANDGKATIKTVDATVARHTIRHNTGNDVFSCYASGQADVYIYKYEAKTKEVAITSAGWATACLPFNATISDNATAYYVTTSGSTLNKVEANVIPANEGVLLKSNEGGAATVTFTESAVAADVVEANYMKGSVAGKTFNDTGYKYYILANDGTHGLGFYYQVEDGVSATCAAGKAVLAVPTTSGAKAFFSLDNEPTGIESLTPALSEGKGVYNLNGLKVNEAYKGIVIMNGKKYINK